MALSSEYGIFWHNFNNSYFIYFFLVESEEMPKFGIFNLFHHFSKDFVTINEMTVVAIVVTRAKLLKQ